MYLQIDTQTKPVLTSSFFSIARACLGAWEAGGDCVTKGRVEKLLMRRRSRGLAGVRGERIREGEHAVCWASGGGQINVVEVFW